MTDNESHYTEEDLGTSREDAPKDTDRRRLISLLAAAAAVFIVVLVLLMFRGCGSVFGTANRNGSTKQIVPVEGLKPVDGSISVWLAAGTDLQGALAAAQVTGSLSVDMGGGRYIVSVPAGTEVDAARRLKDVDGVHDAGRVYSDEATTAP